MRRLSDRETISVAKTAAETGHLVLATLHTDNAVRTVNRIIGSFRPDQQVQVRSMVSESLRVVLSQLLFLKQKAAYEIDAARSVVPQLPRGAFYLDVNSVS